MNKNHTEMSSIFLSAGLSQLFCENCDKFAEIVALSAEVIDKSKYKIQTEKRSGN